MTYLGPKSFDPELVEKAARALAEAEPDQCFDCAYCDMTDSDGCSCGEDREYYRSRAIVVLSTVAPTLRAEGTRPARPAEHSEGCEKWTAAAPGQRACVCKAYQRGYGDD